MKIPTNKTAEDVSNFHGSHCSHGMVNSSPSLPAYVSRRSNLCIWLMTEMEMGQDPWLNSNK